MVQQVNVRSICGTCIYRSDCLSLKNSMKEGNPILHCEEFDDHEFRNVGDHRLVPKTYIRIHSFSMRNLIPGWSA